MQEALLIRDALVTQPLKGRSCLLLGSQDDTKCQAVGRSARNSRFQGCYWCSLEATDSDLANTLVSLPHLVAQDSSSPTPSNMTIGRILRSIFVKTSAKTRLTLLQFLYDRAYEWMVTSPVPKFMVIHVFKLAARCEAGCKKLACDHHLRVVQSVESTDNGDKIIAIPGMASAWILVHKENKYQLLSAVVDDPPMAFPVTPQPRLDRRQRPAVNAVLQLQPAPRQNLAGAEPVSEGPATPARLNRGQVPSQFPTGHPSPQTQLFQVQSPRTQSLRQLTQVRNLGQTQLQLRAPAS